MTKQKSKLQTKRVLRVRVSQAQYEQFVKEAKNFKGDPNLLFRFLVNRYIRNGVK